MAEIFEFPTGSKRDWENYRKSIIQHCYEESAAKLGLPVDIAETVCERMKDDFFKYTTMIGEINISVRFPASLSAEENEIIRRSIGTAVEDVQTKVRNFFNQVILDRCNAEWRILMAEGRGEEKF